MTTPPIPPNCPYFSEKPYNQDGIWFSAYPEHWTRQRPWSHDEDFPWSLNGESIMTPGRKVIIAAVAEVAWLKEAERIEREECEGDPFDTGFGLVFDTKYRPAMDNAAAWRAWGDQK